MRKIFSIICIHIIFGALALYLVSMNWQPGLLPRAWRFEQLRSYVTHSNCPLDYVSFTYCIALGGETTIFLGDSSVLAFSKDADKRPLIIGAGSCPLIPGLIVSFSQPECEALSEALVLKLKMGKLDKVTTWTLVHRSEYFSEISPERYVKLLKSFTELIHARSPHAEVLLVMEPPSLNLNVTKCIPRRVNLEVEKCFAFHSAEYKERLQVVLSKLPFITIVEPDESMFRRLPPDRLLSLYKDRVHITEKAALAAYPRLMRKVI